MPLCDRVCRALLSHGVATEPGGLSSAIRLSVFAIRVAGSMAVYSLSALLHTFFKIVVRVALPLLPVSGLDYHNQKTDGNTSDGDLPESPGKSQNGEIHFTCAFNGYPL